MTKREAKKQAAQIAKNWQGGVLIHYVVLWTLNYNPINEKVAKELIRRLGLVEIPEVSFNEREEGIEPPVRYAKPDYVLGAMKALELVYLECSFSDNANIKHLYEKLKKRTSNINS